MSATEECAEWVVSMSYAQIPTEVLHQAKRSILDGLGVGLAGATQPVGKIATEYTRSLGSSPQSGVIGGGFKTDMASAAFTNGVLIHALDWDDEWVVSGHPTASALSASLAVADQQDSSGKDLLTAYITGLEVHGKLAEGGLRPGVGFNHVFNVMNAVTAASKMLRLDQWKTRMAMGIAASHASGLSVNQGTMTKPYQQGGNSAFGGVRGALLARAGFMADPGALEGKNGRGGFGPAFMGERFDPSFTKKLGSPFHFASPGMSIKKYPACYFVQGALDSILQLLQEHKVSSEEVDEVIVHSRILDNPDPDQALRGKFSMQYTMAAALVDGRIDVNSYSDERVFASDVREAIKKIKLDGDGDPRHPLVEIRLADGRCLSREQWPHGDVHDPLSDDEVVEKFYAASGHLVSRTEATRIIDMVMNIEELASTRALTTLLTNAGQKQLV